MTKRLTDDEAIARLDVVEFLRFIVTDPEYRRNLLARARSGSLAPQVQECIEHYAASDVPPPSVSTPPPVPTVPHELRVLEFRKAK